MLRMERTMVRAAWIAVAFLATGVAAAQTNSLRKAGIAHAPAQPVSTTVRSQVEAPPPNPVLLNHSLIAVEAPKPRLVQVHDLVTIIVREDKRAMSDANLENEKRWRINSELSKWFRLDSRDRLVPQTFPRGTPGIGFDFNNRYEGEGRTTRADSLITRITAEVVDVKPNGTLVLEARKTIEVDEDTQILTLTGICRREDVDASNTILSTQLADAHITARHLGPARDAARRGWLMRGLDLLRPF